MVKENKQKYEKGYNSINDLFAKQVIRNLKKAKVKTNKLSENPLFITFLNWGQDKYSIEKLLDRLLDSFERSEDKEVPSRRELLWH